jgi:DNA-binding NarL/FixJ family response regulator
MDVQTQHKHSGLAAAKRIKKAFPNIKIVIVTSLVDPQVLEQAKTGAADSLWYKDHGTEELISVIKRTLAGEKVFPDTSPAIEMEGTMSDTFSPRQLDILRLYIKGFTYQEIADKLGISKNGVRWNLDDMVEKGGFENREALVVTAIENKLMVTTLKDE